MEETNVYEKALNVGRMSAQRIIEEEFVGFKNDVEHIMKLLTKGTKEFDIISIVGIPGLGKTTFAKKVFKDCSTISHFDVLASCCVSQTYNVRELLFDIYSQVTGVKRNTNMDDDIYDMLRKFLLDKRYLILLDDVWQVAAWEELSSCFPTGGNRSRVMLTTRLQDLAMEVKCYSDPHGLRFLTREESWELLQKKVFRNETCPPELQDVGLQVAEYCKGLPLIVVIFGGIIAKKERNVSAWSEAANSLKSQVGSVDTETHKVIELSYSYLPDHLKPCLLYMGMHPEDANVLVSRLILLWMAEGFVDRYSDERRLEEVAEGYLADLISSSLVMVSKTSYNGKVKYCKIHDLVRDFCLNKGKECKFMLVIGLHNQNQPSYVGEHRLCIQVDLHGRLKEIEESLYNFVTCKSQKETSLEQNLSSLLVTNEKADYSNYFGRASYVFPLLCDLRLLKVLDLMNFYLKDCSYSTALESLLHLRYLALCCEEFTFDWVLHLSQLETLLVNPGNRVFARPNFCKMIKLRHVSISTCILLANEIAKEPSKLENLRTFNNLELNAGKDMDQFMERFPNVQHLNLRLCSLGKIYRMRVKLQVLTQLQSLVLDHYLLSFGSAEFYFPSSLKDLVVHNFSISSSLVSAIAGLHNLERLKFVRCNFEQNEWDVRDTIFPALKFLKVGDASIRQWLASETSFPMLEILVIKKCGSLEEIPYSFVDVPTLRLIKVNLGKQSLDASALQIKEQVEEDSGCDNLEVHIWPDYRRRHLQMET